MMPRRSAFTLVELLITVVLVSILTGLVVARFWQTRQMAFVASVKWELRNALPRAEAHFLEHGSNEGLTLASRTPEVLLEVLQAGSVSYRVRGTHTQASGVTCLVEGGALADGADAGPMVVGCGSVTEGTDAP
jgi:prepilin-type N-terminal cleavage/methylation domain-containing protein